MKKAIIVLLALFTTALLFTGCGSLSGKGQEQSFKVYSFSGENDVISVSNGVIVLDDKDEICYGGNLKVDPDEFIDIVAYSVTVYLYIDNEKEILMSNSVEDMTGGIIDAPCDIGKVSGDIIKNNDIDKLNDNLWIEFKTTDLNGENDTYQLQLKMTEITKKTDR